MTSFKYVLDKKREKSNQFNQIHPRKQNKIIRNIQSVQYLQFSEQDNQQALQKKILYREKTGQKTNYYLNYINTNHSPRNKYIRHLTNMSHFDNKENEKMEEVEDEQQLGLYFDDDNSQYNYHHNNKLKDSGDSLLDVLIKSYKDDRVDMCCNENFIQNQAQQEKQIYNVENKIQQPIINDPIKIRKRSHPVQKSKQGLLTKSSLNSQITNLPQVDSISTLIQAQQPKSKQRKSTNQHIYAKNYRQKKKQQFKILQEENSYLKRKMAELQSRIRELQSELAKMKFAPKSVMTLQESNRHFHNGGLNYGQLIHHDRNKFDQQQSQVINISQRQRIDQILQKCAMMDEQQLCKQYVATYDTYGFAGKRKIEKLQFHMNQFMENVLKDSQKYLALIAINNRGLLGESLDEDYPETNYTMFELMQYDPHKLELVHKMLKPVIKPAMEKLLHACQKLHIYFQNVFNQIYRAHEFFKKSLNTDFLSVKQRLQMENYFQCNKYSKQLRRMREDWIVAVRDQQEKVNYEQMRKKMNKQVKQL